MIDLRLANIEDAQSLPRINIDTWRSSYPGIVPDEYLNNLSYNAEKYKEILSNPDNITYVAEKAGQITGYACAGVDKAPAAPASCKLWMLYIRQRISKPGHWQKTFLKNS